jgi:hypothetical protein
MFLALVPPAIAIAAGTGYAANPAGPRQVPGLVIAGTATRTIAVTVRDADGRVLEGVAPGVEVLRTAAWSPDDPGREGASEFEVLLAVARLVRTHRLAGVVSVANDRGTALPPAERALLRATAMGVPVVRVGPAEGLAIQPDGFFVNALGLSPEEASRVLGECLLSFGALPPARNPLAPSPAERDALRAQVARYQQHFETRTGVRVAAR